MTASLTQHHAAGRPGTPSRSTRPASINSAAAARVPWPPGHARATRTLAEESRDLRRDRLRRRGGSCASFECGSSSTSHFCSTGAPVSTSSRAPLDPERPPNSRDTTTTIMPTPTYASANVVGWPEAQGGRSRSSPASAPTRVPLAQVPHRPPKHAARHRRPGGPSSTGATTKVSTSDIDATGTARLTAMAWPLKRLKPQEMEVEGQRQPKPDPTRAARHGDGRGPVRRSADPARTTTAAMAKAITLGRFSAATHPPLLHATHRRAWGSARSRGLGIGWKHRSHEP